ncbi:MAG: YfhO family protein [bacterium]|nr:YfhO family protein [bacterium]
MKGWLFAFTLLPFAAALFFYPVLLSGKLPIPSDTIVGLYHPYRDFYRQSFPNGIPFKNFLITDPVRQQYPWRELSVEIFSQGRLPLWNPYSGSGSPLSANFQSGAFYPLNILYLFFPFTYSWTLQVMLQCVLSALFMFIYLRFLKLRFFSCILGSLTFAFSGFSVAWLEWNTMVQTVMWVPLLLFAKEKFLTQRRLKWAVLLIFSESSLLLAGHLQIAFYSLLVINLYLLVRVLQMVNKRSSGGALTEFFRIYTPFFFIGVLVAVITSIQWIPTLQLILHSARDIDQSNWQKEGWFLPWQNLVQFVAPDFFGNPSTLNYSGVWNYAEFIGYVGVIPLLMSLLALGFRRDRKTAFFGSLFFFSLLFSLPTFFAKIPFFLSIPFLSSAQPTRLLSVTDFSLAVLTALGADMFLVRKKYLLYPLVFLGVTLCCLWVVSFLSYLTFGMTADQLAIARNNLKLPTILFVSVTFVYILFLLFRQKKLQILLLAVFVGITLFDLYRFGWKFTPFVEASYVFPVTKTLSFLQKDPSKFRVMTTDSRILPPNFSSVYRVESIDIYDPLYLLRYGEFVAASERGVPNIDPPFGFNRILTPHNSISPLVNLMNVKYVLSFSDIGSKRFEKVFQEGSTMVFKNNNYLPRYFFARELMTARDKKDAMQKIFTHADLLESLAVVEDLPNNSVISGLSDGVIDLVTYSANQVDFKVQNDREAFFVLLDVNYPTWHAYLSSPGGFIETKIFQTDFLFRGVFIPRGEHILSFRSHLL